VPTTKSLIAVDDEVPNDVWVVGKEATIFRYNGSWTRVAAPGVIQDLNAVWTVGHDVWIGGQGGLIMKATVYGG
jgi:hypothetical protein